MYIDKALPCLYKSLKSVHVCVSNFTLIQFYFHLNVLLFYRLEAEDEDQGIDSLEKELADVSWSDRIRVSVFPQNFINGGGGGTILCTFDCISIDKL
jgi:hypothetical protein